MANFPSPSLSITAFQPAKLLIFFTFPFSTPVASPRLSICFEILSLFSILPARFLSLLESSSTVSSSLPSNPVYTWFAAGSLSVVAVGLASTERFLRNFGLLLSVVAVTSAGFVADDVVDGSSAFTVVCSLFSTLFASVDDASVFFSVDFSSVAEVADDTTGAGVASAGFEVVVSAWAFETVDDTTDVELASAGAGVVVSAWPFGAVESLAPEFSSNWLFAGVAARAESVAVTFGSAAYTAPFPKNIKNAATATLAAPKLTFRTE